MGGVKEVWESWLDLIIREGFCNFTFHVLTAIMWFDTGMVAYTSITLGRMLRSSSMHPLL